MTYQQFAKTLCPGLIALGFAVDQMGICWAGIAGLVLLANRPLPDGHL
jgi:hypothetical protein